MSIKSTTYLLNKYFYFFSVSLLRFLYSCICWMYLYRIYDLKIPVISATNKPYELLHHTYDKLGLKNLKRSFVSLLTNLIYLLKLLTSKDLMVFL